MARIPAAPPEIADRSRPRGMRHSPIITTILFLSALPLLVTAQERAQSGQCIPLKGSRLCPAFDGASVSTQQSLIDNFSFLQYVSDTGSFDDQLETYIGTDYVRSRYQNRFGCEKVDLRNSSSMYARWTTTVLCSSMVQASIDPCRLSSKDARPLCADSCAEFAQSEAAIASDRALCSNPAKDLEDLIRADYTVCGLPVKSLSGDCVQAVANEAQNCGFSGSIIGLCGYCAAGGINSTDTCCYNSQAETRCRNVKLPTIVPTLSLTSSTSSPTATGNNDSSAGDHGHLGGGAIAGIVIGSLAALALLALLLFFCTRILRRRRANASQSGSIFNQPSPARKVAPSVSQPPQSAPQGYEVLPGGRIARMSALEGHSGGSPSQHKGLSTSVAAAAVGRPDSRKVTDQSSSDEYVDSPEYEDRHAGLRPPPMAARRHGSLSSASALGSDGQTSPATGPDFSSPQGFGSQQSEQLPFFKDYYSQDDIHPGDRVAVLWAYSPRAGDEFSLERGDMIKVVGIWDDGWATGHMLPQRAEDLETSRTAHRDSGVSGSSARDDGRRPPTDAAAEMKAFPLVCVCLPQHWRRTIEGDGSTETGSIAGPAMHAVG